jgi:hypothetical protein
VGRAEKIRHRLTRPAGIAFPCRLEAVDVALAECLSPEELRGLRRCFVELISTKEELEAGTRSGGIGQLD